MPENQRLNRIKSRILGSYRKTESLRLHDGRLLPNMPDVNSLLQSMFALLYPDYYSDHPHETTIDIEDHTSRIIQNVSNRLSGLIQACIGTQQYDSPEQIQQNTGKQLCLEFLEKIPILRESLQCDVEAALNGDPAANCTAEVILCYPGLYAVTVYRIAHELHRLKVPLLPRIMTEIAHQRTGIDIHPGARIGRYFFIDHGTGVVIGETAVIDDHVKLYQGVTLGALSFPKDQFGNLIRRTDRHPKIGKGVTIYANATILGGNTYVGDQCVIGGSAFITQSVDSSHTVKIAKPELRLRQNHLVNAETDIGLQSTN